MVNNEEARADGSRKLGNQLFYFEKVKLQLTVRHPGGDVKQAVG